MNGVIDLLLHAPGLPSRPVVPAGEAVGPEGDAGEISSSRGAVKSISNESEGMVPAGEAVGPEGDAGELSSGRGAVKSISNESEGIVPTGEAVGLELDAGAMSSGRGAVKSFSNESERGGEGLDVSAALGLDEGSTVTGASVGGVVGLAVTGL